VRGGERVERRERERRRRFGGSGADGRAPPGGGGGSGSATRAARAGRGEGVGAVGPPRHQAGPRRGWATWGEGNGEGERAARLAGLRGAHDGEGRGVGWAVAGSRPKKGGEREIPLLFFS
jgi:hypothetical protein